MRIRCDALRIRCDALFYKLIQLPQMINENENQVRRTFLQINSNLLLSYGTDSLTLYGIPPAATPFLAVFLNLKNPFFHLSYYYTLPFETNFVYNINLSNLKAGATYHYRVRSRDSTGNEAVSEDNYFKTDDEAPFVVPD